MNAFFALLTAPPDCGAPSPTGWSGTPESASTPLTWTLLSILPRTFSVAPDLHGIFDPTSTLVDIFKSPFSLKFTLYPPDEMAHPVYLTPTYPLDDMIHHLQGPCQYHTSILKPLSSPPYPVYLWGQWLCFFADNYGMNLSSVTVVP